MLLPDEASTPSAPGPYLSEEHKRRFTIVAGVLGAVFFFGQLLLPFVAMLFVAPVAFTSRWMSFSEALVERSALWGGGIWYVERELMQAAAPSANQAHRLVRVPFAGGGEPQVMATLETDEAWLLDGGDRLWVISPAKVQSWHGGELHSEWQGADLGCMTRPFRVDGRPAVVTQDPEGFSLRVFGDDGWEVRGRFALQMLDRFTSASEDMQIVSSAQGLQVFVKAGDTLYWRPGMPPDGDSVEAGPWQAVCRIKGAWTSAEIDGRPAVFHLDPGPSTRLVGLRHEGGSWREFFTAPMLIGRVAAFQGAEPGRFTVVSSGFPGSLLILSVQDGKVVDRATSGSGFPFPKMMLPMVLIPQAASLGMPLILALIFTVLMARHRTSSFHSDGTSVEFASLARRAFAQLIDAVILSGPVVAAFVLTFSRMFDSRPDDFRGPEAPSPWDGARVRGSGLGSRLLPRLLGHRGRLGDHSREVAARHSRPGHRPEAVRLRQGADQEPAQVRRRLLQLHGRRDGGGAQRELAARRGHGRPHRGGGDAPATREWARRLTHRCQEYRPGYRLRLHSSAAGVISRPRRRYAMSETRGRAPARTNPPHLSPSSQGGAAIGRSERSPGRHHSAPGSAP